MSLFEKRVEAAARVIYDVATALVPDAWDHESDDEKAWWLNHAREVLLAADAVVTEEAPRVQLHAQRGGKTSRMIDQILDRADERGVTIEVVYPEPTEEMIADTLCSYQRHTGDRECEYDHETARAILALFRGGAR